MTFDLPMKRITSQQQTCEAFLLLPSCFTNSCISAMKLLRTQTAQLHFPSFSQSNTKSAVNRVLDSPAGPSGGGLYVFLPDLRFTKHQRTAEPPPAALCPAVNSDTRNHNQTSLSRQLHPWDSFSSPKRCPMSSFSVVLSSGVASVFPSVHTAHSTGSMLVLWTGRTRLV